MSASDPNGWHRLTCNFCGTTRPHTVFISIQIATGDDSPYPYSQTDLCRECWDQHGITAALEHNAWCKEVI